MYTRTRIIRVAWLEWRVNADFKAANPVLRATHRAPLWFIDDELGYGPGQGPSIEANMNVIERSNQHRRVVAKRMSIAESRRVIRERLAASGGDGNTAQAEFGAN